MSGRKKIEYGDFQTPDELATQVVRLLQIQDRTIPHLIVEPTCGVGSFVVASIQAFKSDSYYYAFDINADYLHQLHEALVGTCTNGNVSIICQDFFAHDWSAFFKNIEQDDILVIGNPPWVTNSALGALNSKNLPTKTNFQGHKGFEAKTGKANFDIAEWMLIKLIEGLQGKVARVAMLCKTATARKVLHYIWLEELSISETSLHRIDAKKHFDVSVDACLFMASIGRGASTTSATVYNGLNFTDKHSRFGLYQGELIANLEDYQQFKSFRGTSPYTWRSGIKHDAAKVMELSQHDEHFVNGFGEVVDIEDTYLFPLLKSSDIGNNRLVPRKHVLVTQKHVGEPTQYLKTFAPKTWEYLAKYAHILDKRKSSIYRQRPRFSVFGIGEYSFAPWKVTISGMYKSIQFVAIGTVLEKPIMVDDTCYFIPCSTQEEAVFISQLLNSEVCQRFLRSLIFFDAKRPITKDILQRIDLYEIAKYYHTENKAEEYFSAKQQSQFTGQASFSFG